MNLELAASLPLIIPKAVIWAEQRAAEIASIGIALNANEIVVARGVGVANPEKIRLAFVTRLPLPDDPQLRQAAVSAGLLGPNMVGLTLGHGIYICNGFNSSRMLSHECRHVSQYERAGSIAAFLPLYLQQIVQFGYQDAPYEIDARAHEIHA
jgi:hypothetical protein